MARLKSNISFSPRQCVALKRLQSRRTIGCGIAQRVSILVGTMEGKGAESIAKEMDISKTTVILWRKRWMASQEVLLELELGLEDGAGGDGKLGDGILDLLADKPRSGAPRSFTVAQDILIVSMASRSPREFSVPQNVWTYVSLAREAANQGIVNSISSVQVWIVLKKYGLPAAPQQVLDAPENRQRKGLQGSC